MSRRAATRPAQEDDAPDRTPDLMSLGRVLQLWRHQAGGLALGLLVSLLALACALGLLALSGLRLAGAAVGIIALSAWLLRGLGVGRVLLRYVERLLTHEATFRALADLRVWFFRSLTATAAGGLGFRHAGDVLSRLVGDVEALDGLYLRLLVPLCGALLVLPVLLLVLARAGLPLALSAGALFVLTAFLLPWLAARRTAAAGGRLAVSASRLRITVLDLASGLREVCAFDAGARMLGRIAVAEDALLRAQSALARATAWTGAGAFLFGQLAVGLVIAAALGLGFAPIPPLEAVLCLFLLLSCFELATGLVRAGVLAGHMGHAAGRVLEAAQGEAPPAGRTDPMPGSASLRFDGVSYRWQPDRPLVLDHLSLEVPAGARVALLGASGAGKSTLASLLLRVAIPGSGHILIGDADLQTIAEPALREGIAWLGQQSHLFDESVRANLLLGRPEASEPELWAALDQAQIGDFVRGLPDRLDSWLGESGTLVSGGQGRRLALARVLLSRAPILILDEPGVGLDADTERAFLRTLNQVAEGRTIVLVAHRLTGVERLDRVWRLEHGKAVAAPL